VYLDDIIVIGRTFQTHLDNLRKVFQRLPGAHLKINPEKCRLFQKEVWYLGHMVSPQEVTKEPEKLEAVKMLAATDGQASAEELSWTVHVLPEVHF
jgi:hypothetical protein